MTEINLDNLDDFIRGTAILGTGGGGDPYIGSLMLRQELEKCGSIQLINPKDAPDDMLAVSVACMGAPTVFVEKIPNTKTAIEGMRRSEKEIGRKFNAVIPLEAGGLNATLPLAVAARLGLPVVDGDGMGRAFPEFQMTTFNFSGVRCAPFVMSDDFGNTVVIDTDDASRAESYGRPVCVKMGGIAQIASYAMTGEEIRRCTVPRTVTLALEIGRTVREARIKGEQNTAEALISYFKISNPPRFSRTLFDGKVEDVVRESSDGWVRGQVNLVNDAGNVMDIPFQNEYSRASFDGKTVAINPDLIMILDRETGEAITTETLRYGQRVRVLGVAAVPIMRTSEALKVIGPRAFGMDEDFCPIENIAWNGTD
jgi:DUF917 family protein